MLHLDVLKLFENFEWCSKSLLVGEILMSGSSQNRGSQPLQKWTQTYSPKQLAVHFTSQTAGAQLIQESIPKSSLEVYCPMKKNLYCMVIKGLEGGGGESIGSVPNMTNAYIHQEAEGYCSAPRWYSSKQGNFTF